MEKKISFVSVLTQGAEIGIKNVVPLILTCLLWILTIWIPYINVGTTIAISTIPLQLSKGKIINPLFIFNAEYRQFMGEFLILIAIMSMAIMTAAFFFLIPAIVVGLSWSLAVLLLLDKQISPMDAIMQSNKATYGYKKTIFAINLVLGLAYCLVNYLLLPVFSILFPLILGAIYAAISWSCTAVIYRDLTKEDDPTPTPEVAPEPSSTVEEAAPAPAPVDDDNPFAEILNS
ncbi:MAG: hypothetical protein SNH94_00080 [Rikenellaceae bacterium]